ncbi:MAG: beta-N-acetylhexosaminidase [Proteobacteria bacterium]|nr:beta-N-acetylhexosaminidase [Pseudomonadota bacterium]MBI3496006.1 beta-N-acetylhexosaminidase [Pseudomonadota bacterium]
MSNPEPSGRLPTAVVFGVAGVTLAAEERRFLRDADPLGFILMQRNCRDPQQVRALVLELRATVGRAVPVLIDQEGGRVARMKPPHWRAAPAAARFGELAQRDRAAGLEACRLNARLLAAELAPLGVSVNCLPVLDLSLPETHKAIGDRAYAADPMLVAALGRAAADGLIEGGVLPVIKHMPGHGRATVDSHHDLPVVTTAAAVLEATDFAAFRANADLPWGMTAHVVYKAIDALPATVSPTAISRVIRGSIGFGGFLISDDLGMKALPGGFADRAQAALAAGCDAVLHCSGDMGEMAEVMAGVRRLTDESGRRLAAGAQCIAPAASVEMAGLVRRLERLLAVAA